MTNGHPGWLDEMFSRQVRQWMDVHCSNLDEFHLFF